MSSDVSQSSNQQPAPDFSQVEAYRSALIAYFRRRPVPGHEAEDLAQDVIERILKRIVSSKTIDNFEAYVFQAASNLLRDVYRRDSVRKRYLGAQKIVENAVEEISPERVLIGKDQLTALKKTLNRLSKRTRNIFLLHRVEGLKHKEIADMYGISSSAVEKHVMKAVAHIARTMRT